MTGYKLAKRANAALRFHGLKEIPAQMIYSYISQDFIPSSNVNGQKLVTESDADEWIAKYVARRLEKANA